MRRFLDALHEIVVVTCTGRTPSSTGNPALYLWRFGDQIFYFSELATAAPAATAGAAIGASNYMHSRTSVASNRIMTHCEFLTVCIPVSAKV